MEFPLPSQRNLVAATLAFLIILYYLFLVRNRSKNSRAAPEAGGAWPLIGHLHLLGGPEPSHRVLGKMADKYGPIFTIKTGLHKALVVSNSEIAKECLTTNDRVFASRPKTVAMEVLGYNFSMFGFCPYGSYWRQARKIATLELLSNNRLEKLKHVRESETRTSIKELYEIWVKNRKNSSCSSNKVLVEMQRWFGDITLNVILRMIVGKRCDDGEVGDKLKEELVNFFLLSGKFVVSDVLPFLRWFDIGGEERFMKKTSKEIDVVAQGWLDEHKRKRAAGQVKGGEEDFMDVMMSVLGDGEQFPGRDADTINKATCLALILAGTDTTSLTMTWALSLLLNNRDVLMKAQNELDIQVGKERQVNELDMKNLVYLQAIIKETMRLYPSGPLAVPHKSIKDSTVNGYHVPAGTQLYVNIWKIHHDPSVWPDPFEFKPERFITTHKDFDVRGQNFELIPFSSGRRMCPAVSLGLQIAQLSLAALLHGFDFATPSDGPIDMTEGLGLTLVKTNPLEVLLSPRLPTFLYD